MAANNNQQVIVAQQDSQKLAKSSLMGFCKARHLKEGDLLDWLEVQAWACSAQVLGASNADMWYVMASSFWTPHALESDWAALNVAQGVQPAANFDVNVFEVLLQLNWCTSRYVGLSALSLSDRHFESVEALVTMAKFAKNLKLHWSANDFVVMQARANYKWDEVTRVLLKCRQLEWVNRNVQVQQGQVPPTTMELYAGLVVAEGMTKQVAKQKKTSKSKKRIRCYRCNGWDHIQSRCTVKLEKVDVNNSVDNDWDNDSDGGEGYY